jgi:ankyrin repeat protein
MPPTGPLPQEKIDVIKAWIDEGAPWPDTLSGETPPPPPDPGATALMAALRRGDSAAFKKNLAEDPKAATRKGPGGSTPLMYAALYGDAKSVKRLLAAGADPNAKNDAGATALMWAVFDLEKTRLLVDHGADVNARSDNARTPLMIAATRHGSTPVLQFLLAHGANPSVQNPGLFGPMTPLAEAAYASDVDAMRTLIAHGADVNGAGPGTLAYATEGYCVPCIDLVIGSTDKANVAIAPFFDMPPLGDALLVKSLLDRGADPKAIDPGGDTLLTLASASDAAPAEVVRTLLDRGVDVNAASKQGDTALALAMRHGHTPVVDLLVQAGARPADAPADQSEIKPLPAHSAREAVERSLPLLQRNGAEFMHKSGCVSCHNNTLTAMTVATARRSGITVDDQVAAQQARAIGIYLEGWRERALQGVGIPGDADSISEILLGMAHAKYPPDPATDAMALFLKNHQAQDGRWYATAHRPPLESSDIQTTAVSMHDLQSYAPQAQRAAYDGAVERAAAWLAKAQPRTTQDRAYQLLGLAWAGTTDSSLIKHDGAALVAEQRPDGGWAQLPTLSSDAFATGQALVALAQSGALAVSDPVYQRGVQFLMSTQLADGSWYVKRRALPIQPYFESGFPHGHDQFISAAATNWATTALALAAGSSGSVSARLAKPQ